MRFTRRLVMRTFSFPAMLASSLAVLAVLTVRSRFSDPDLWWHLRTGQIIATGHLIPRVDLLSFTTGEHAWVAHEWLTQFLLFVVWKAAGYQGLMLWFCSMTVALLLIEYALCWLYSNNLKGAFVGALVAWFFATIGLAIRPQLVGYLLLACELVLVELGRSRNPRWFLLLPPLFALWVNCHGSFLLGLGLLAIVLVSSFLPRRAGLIESRQLDPLRRRMLAWSSALCLPAIFANPVGLSLLAYPLRTMFDSRMQLDAVSEWRWLAFDDPRAFGLIAVAGAILLLPLLRRASLYWDEGFMVAAMLGLALLHQRLLFAWGIVAAPVLCRHFAPLWSGYAHARASRWLKAGLMVAALAAIFAFFPKTEELRAQVARNNPVQAVDYLRRAHLSG